MMYALEHLTRQGPEHQWKQYAVCAKKDLLERIRHSQPRPEEWRVRLWMMKIFKSTKPAVCGAAKRPIRRWPLPPKNQQAYRFYSTAHFHVYERCRHFRRG